MTDRVDANLLAAAQRLRIVATLKGFDSYDVTACAAAGVWWPSSSAQRAAENVLAVLSGTRPPDATNQPLSSMATPSQGSLMALSGEPQLAIGECQLPIAR